ncbi:MAG: transketolase C-terminal domain-containing protein, partial [Oscillospiraceae bacterium]
MGGMNYTAVESTKMATAEIYGKTLVELGEKDKRVVALTADLAKSTKIGDFQKKFPERFFNVGIAEQNLFGIAAGMAKSGLIPFASTFSVFASMRATDQLHTDICYQKANVKIIGTHSGTSFGQAGSTHHAIEDIAMVRSLVNLQIIVPADGYETANAIRAAYEINGPVYIRINRGFDQVLYKSADYGFEFGKGVLMNEGDDITIIANGSCVFQAVQAAKILESDYKIHARVINLHTVKPIDKEIILKAVDETRRIITVEDHTIIGGLGTAVGEVVLENGKACAFKKLGLNDCFSAIGFHEDLMSINGIDSEGIVKATLDTMKNSKVVELACDGKVQKALKFDDRDFEVDIDWTD